MEREGTDGRGRSGTGRVILAGLLVSLAACSGTTAPSAPSRSAAPPIDATLVNATTRQPLGAPPDAALDRLASGASAGTLLARGTRDEVCIFANGRNGWNRAAC